MTTQDKFKKVWNDPKLFIENFMRINDKTNKSVPFVLNEVQSMLFREASKYNIFLKSRQVGGSSGILARALWMCITKPNTHCMMLAHSGDSTRNIFNKAKQLYRSIPDVIKPKLIKNNRSELQFSNGSLLSVATLSSKDSARGSTLQLIHLSEFAFCEDANAKSQLLALEQALVPNGEIWLESTGNGLNHYHSAYTKALNGESSYKPIFANYLDGACLFLDDFQQAWDTFKNRHGREFTVEDLTDEEKGLIEYDSRHTLPIILWRRMKIANSGEEQFNQEYPLTPEMSFISTGTGVFNNAIIHEHLKHLPKPIAITHPVLTGYCHRGLSIFKEPIRSRKYSAGVDVAEGIGRDSSTISVFDCVTREEVAHFNSNKIPPHEFANIVHQVALYYNYAFLVIEKASAGSVVLDKLRNDWAYMNLYKSKVFDERGNTKKKIGWVSSEKTRSILINEFREAFDMGLIRINSKETYREMLTFVASESGKMGHTKGSHDDSVFAVMLSIFGIDKPHYVVPVENPVAPIHRQ